jgi:phosphate transport system protein
MSHYEERLEHDLEEIQRHLAEVGANVLAAFSEAVHAVLIGDNALASRIILDDLPINRHVRRVDKLCHAFVARHLPSAGHLRFVSSALRTSIALERIGDYAVTIAREQVQLSSKPPGAFAGDLELIAEQAEVMLRQALDAYNAGNAELARGTRPMGAQIEGTFQKVFDDLVAEGERGGHPLVDLFALLMIINRIGRVADQAKNICEETVFAATGETKEPKTYSILFIDEKDDSLTRLAAAYGRRAFPDSAVFSSAGWAAAARVDPRAGKVAEANGLDLGDARPTPLASLADRIDDIHVVVSLQDGGRRHLGRIPYHTVLLEWQIAYPHPESDQQRLEAGLEQGLRTVSVEIGRLLEVLRGEGAG